MVLKEFNLTDEEVSNIQNFNTELVTLKNLIKELDESTNDFIFNKLLGRLKEAQSNYDGWFMEMQKKHNVMITPENSWNVDFSKKILQLV